MNYLKSFISKGDSNNEQAIIDEVSKVAQISDCAAECDANECHTTFPNSARLDPQIAKEPLWNSTKPYGLHCLVSTGRTDWVRSPTDEANTLAHAVDQWAEKSSSLVGGTKIKVTVSSLPINDSDPDCLASQKGDVLILPYFVWVRDCPMKKVDDVLTKLVPILYENNQAGTNTIPTEIDGIVIETSNLQAYVFLCSHRTRDKKCGITAPLMKRELELHLREHDLLRDFGDDRPNGVQVAFLNHVGGHKFVANMLIYMKNGEYVWFAKCKPTNCKPIIEETILGGGKVWPELIRNIQRCNPITW